MGSHVIRSRFTISDLVIYYERNYKKYEYRNMKEGGSSTYCIMSLWSGGLWNMKNIRNDVNQITRILIVLQYICFPVEILCPERKALKFLCVNWLNF